MADEPVTSEVEHLLSTGEVAEKLGLTPRAVLHRVHTGTIPVVGQFGVQHQYVFREEDIEALTTDHT